MSPRPRSRTLGRAPTSRKALVGLGVVATALLAFPGIAGAQEADAASPSLGHAGQPALGRHRRRPRDLHAGRLRPRRDRLLPGQARRPRGEHELRHLRPRLRRLLPRRLRLHVRRLRSVPARSASTKRLGEAFIGSGDWVFLWKGGFALTDWWVRAVPVPRPSASSSTWSPSWTPSPRSPPGPWPSGGSGRASSAGASSAAPSTTRCSAPGPGAAAGCRQLGNSHGPRLRLRRLRRLRRRARRGWRRGAGRRHRARPPHRQVQQRTARPTRIPGHHIPMAMLGCFILLFGWFGFNAASTFAATDVQFAVVATNTAIAAAFGAVAAMFCMHVPRPASPTPG